MRPGRPKQFDTEEVIERAMQAFWSNGYEALGLTDLLEYMGISRQSLYNTFGSKRNLFIRTIEHYRQTQLSQAIALLERDGSRVENVKAVVRFFETLALDGSCRGCLVANTLVELGSSDDEIAALLRKILEALRSAIELALREAQTRGELAANKSPEELSRALTNAVIGLAVTGKLQMDPADIRLVYSGTLSMLD